MSSAAETREVGPSVSTRRDMKPILGRRMKGTFQWILLPPSSEVRMLASYWVRETPWGPEKQPPLLLIRQICLLLIRDVP